MYHTTKSSQDAVKHTLHVIQPLSLSSSSGSVIFVKWKEGLWCRARVVEVLQSGCADAVKTCPVDQLASIRVFLPDIGLTRSITLQRYAHKLTEKSFVPFSWETQHCIYFPFLSTRYDARDVISDVCCL